MGILIKIKMPKGCWACPFAVGKYYECLFTKKTTNWGLTTRPSDCPLIEVPTPHGRLIDADALNTYNVSPMYEFCVMGITEEDIGLAETIIEAEGGDT